MENDLIDREVLIERITPIAHISGRMSGVDVYNMIYREIVNCNTAHAYIKCGYWDNSSGESSGYVCSWCATSNNTETEYCPKCGAHMGLMSAKQ